VSPEQTALSEVPPSEAPTLAVVGRLVSMRFLFSALRRKRALWLGMAALGLLIGLAYRVEVPSTYWASATLYLAQPAGTDPAIISANDVSMVSTAGVANAAIAKLGEPGLSQAKLLGKVPAKSNGANVLTISIAGPSAQEALRRTNAVAGAFLTFRSNQYNAQNDAVVKAADAQIAQLQAQVNQLNTQINGLAAGSAQATNLVDEQAALNGQISNLAGAIQQDNLATLGVSQGSRIITSATLGARSQTKTLVLDGLSGLAAGLGLGVIIVCLQAIISNRLRRREDVATLLGVPVAVSVGRVGRRRIVRRPSVRRLIRHPDANLRVLVAYFTRQLQAAEPPRTQLVVAVDDERVPSAALGALGTQLARQHVNAVLVDLTATRALAKALGDPKQSIQQVRVRGGYEFTLVVPPGPGKLDQPSFAPRTISDVARADAIVVAAAVDPLFGAAHLRAWASSAILTVTAGGSTAERLAGTAELLGAAGISVSAAVMTGVDPDDFSVGLPIPSEAPLVRHFEPVAAATTAVHR
jgi:capsular polysaccharide biosynthesis protein